MDETTGQMIGKFFDDAVHSLKRAVEFGEFAFGAPRGPRAKPDAAVKITQVGWLSEVPADAQIFVPLSQGRTLPSSHYVAVYKVVTENAE